MGMENKKENEVSEQPMVKNKKSKKIGTLALVTGAILIVGIVLIATLIPKKEDENTPGVSRSSVEKIIKLSELSSFEAIYNGVAQVMNEKKSEKVDYYVSYEARVKAGIDIQDVEISVDHESKKVLIVLPEVKITFVDVDIASLDFMFVNDKANTETVSEEAYKKCLDDVKEESKNEKAIYELAEENAKNILEAMIRPLINQLDAGYTLDIK